MLIKDKKLKLPKTKGNGFYRGDDIKCRKVDKKTAPFLGT